MRLEVTAANTCKQHDETFIKQTNKLKYDEFVAATSQSWRTVVIAHTIRYDDLTNALKLTKNCQFNLEHGTELKYGTREAAHYIVAPLIRLRHIALYKSVLID